MDGNPDEYCDRLYTLRPGWVTGTISQYDARFLFRRVLEARTDVVVEIGTASGFSTIFICHALHAARETDRIGQDFQIVSYDLSPQFYADPSMRTGEAALQLLNPEMLEHVTFRNPATSLNVKEDFGRDALEFLFVDANHSHPWPTLDLLTTLDCLRVGAEVVLHDINLPLRPGDFPAWGVKYLYDAVDAEKEADSGDPLSNIGSIRVPADKDQFRDQLLSILFAYEWQCDVDTTITTMALT